MKLIDGKETSAAIKKELATDVAQLIDSNQRTPHLAAVLVGDDPASHTYVGAKEKACKSVGMTSSLYKLPAETTEKEILDLVHFLNKDTEVDGFIVQLPLPSHIDEQTVINAIDPIKDVDGFHPENVGKMVLGMETLVSATPHGIMELLNRYNIDTEGKHCVVLGRSNIVGTPMSILMSRKSNPGNATVTLCHSKTSNLKEIVQSADILIAAIGQPAYVKGDWIKKDAVVIDVGMHRIPDASKKNGYRLIGDVDFQEASKRAAFITPVPGGVGPMTIAALLKNTYKAYLQNTK